MVSKYPSTPAAVRQGLTTVLLLALASHAMHARADDEDEARAAMRRGVAAFGRGEAEVALTEYETAKRLAPLANAPYRYAAEALISLGRWQEAVTNLTAYLAKNPNVSDANEVRERIAKIRAEHFQAHLRVTANVDDATVAVDGEPKGTIGWLDLGPGDHRVEVSAPGRRTAMQQVALQGDRETTLVFTLLDEPSPAPPPPESAPPAAGTFPWRTVGWIGVGVGAATLVTTLVIDTAVLGPKISDYRSASDRADPDARSLRDEAKSLQTGVLVGYTAGAVLAVVGAGFALLAPPVTRTTLQPMIGPGVAGVGAHGAF